LVLINLIKELEGGFKEYLLIKFDCVGDKSWPRGG
jgi:hypothetical protein